MEHGMDRITRLDDRRREKFRGAVVRIREAEQIQNHLYHERPVQRDMFPEYDAIAAWGPITICYSGIEQAMKCLLQMRDSYVKKDHKHHEIGKLFHDLAKEEQEVLHESYRRYRSLHDYIPPETVASFLAAIDTGYNTWRYFLLEGDINVLPTTHPGAMLDIWSALCGILDARVFKNHGLYSVEKRIDHHLEMAFDATWAEWNSRVVMTQREADDIRRWRQQRHYKAIINAYIDLLYQHEERNFDAIEVLPSNQLFLNTMADSVNNSWIDNDFAHFLRRAQMGDIIWRPDAGVFEKTERAEEIEMKLIESESFRAKKFPLGPSVRVISVQSVPAYIKDFIYAPRFEGERADDDWSSEDAEWKPRIVDDAQGIEEIDEYEGEGEFEAYRCNIDRLELIIVLYDSKEWIVYAYDNDEVPGRPYHCKSIPGDFRSVREAIRTIEQWRRTEKEEFELFRTKMWNRRGKRRSSDPPPQSWSS